MQYHPLHTPTVLNNPNYRPDIDGLRAIAIICVVLYHLDNSLFSGGFVGVDIFFVISGYLITKLISQEISKTQSFSFKNFYLRRLRRLFPALLFTFGFCLLAGFILFSPSAYQRLSNSAIAALLSVSNLFFWKNSGYFGPDASLEPLLNTWSLSVEEQFYLFWPLILIFIAKRHWFAPTFLLVIVFISLYLNHHYISNSTIIFYLLPFRVFEFAIGSALVYFDQFKPTKNYLLEIIALIGFALISYPIFCFTKYTLFPYFNALYPCVGAGLLIYAGNSKYLGALLRNNLSVKVGLISYSLYLIHWPIIVFYRYYKGADLFDGWHQIFIFVLSLIMATFMYHYIEQPFRRPPKFASNKPFIMACLALGVIVLLTSYFIRSHDGLKWRSHKTVDFVDAGYGGEHYSWNTRLGSQNANSGLIVYGDSHSKQYLAAFDHYAKQRGFAIDYIGHSACFSLPQMTNIYQGKVHSSCIDLFSKLKEITHANNTPVMIAYRYTKTMSDIDGKNQLYYQDNEKLFIDRLLKSLDQMLIQMGDRKILLVGNVPSAKIKRGYLDCITTPLTSLYCHEKFPLKEGEFYSLRAALRNFADKHRNVVFVDPYEALCDQKYCYVVRDNQLYYSDHAHLSVAGANAVLNFYATKIDEFLKTDN